MQEPSILTAIQHPLTALVTSIQLLEEDFEGLSCEQIRERIDAMYSGAFSIHGLIENLLCAATIRDGQLSMRLQPLSLAEMVDELAPVVRPILGRRAQQLEMSIDQTAPEVRADPRRMSQVLVNLILNASEQSGDGAAVGVRARALEDAVRVSVTDRGPELPEGSRDLLFESRLRPAQQGSSEAAGLGLAVARWIVEAHGGTVGAQNRRSGGARFWFQLPAAA